MLLQVVGATPAHLIIALGKDGQAYLSLIFGKCSFLNSVGIDSVVGQSWSPTCWRRHEVQNDGLDLGFISGPQPLGLGLCTNTTVLRRPGRPISRPSSNSASECACRESSTWSLGGLSKILRFSVFNDTQRAD